MSVQIANVDLSAATVGTTGSISWAQMIPPPTIAQQMRPQDNHGGPTVLVFNESPCQLKVTLPVTGQSFSLTSGRWVSIAIPPNEESFTYVVSAVAAGTGLFNNLLVDYYAPGEPVDPIGALGNSPIALSQAVQTSITQVIQDGQASGQTIVESTPSGGHQTINWTTQGELTLYPLSSDDALKLMAHDNTQTVALGSGPAGSGFPGFYCFDSTGNDFVFFGRKSGMWFKAPISAVGNQQATGSLGVPVIVAQALDVAVTVTTQQNILSYTAPATGYYRVSAYLAVKGTGTPSVVLGVFYDDPLLGPGQNTYLIGETNAGVKAYSGQTTNVANQIIAPMIVKSASSHVIQVFYQNSAATPNDLVTVFIERMS